MSENGSLLIETQTRYCRADESVALQLKVMGAFTTAPPMGEVSVAALCVSQLAAVATVNLRCAEKVASHPLLKSVSTYHSSAPLGSCNCADVPVAVVVRAARMGELPLTEIQRP